MAPKNLSFLLVTSAINDFMVESGMWPDTQSKYGMISLAMLGLSSQFSI